MKIEYFVGILFVLGFSFLWGFSTGYSPYMAARMGYYEQQAQTATDQEDKDVWQELVLFNPVTTICVDTHPPRPTRIAWLGASEDEVRAWALRNELACLARFERQMRMIGNPAGTFAAKKAMASLR